MKAKVIFVPDDYQLPDNFDITKTTEPPPATIKPKRKSSPAKYKKDPKVIKAELLEYMGGACKRCGYREFSAALCFHHTGIEVKDNGVSSFISRYCVTPTDTNMDLVIKEARKCIVLCANCHNALHAGEWSL